MKILIIAFIIGSFLAGCGKSEKEMKHICEQEGIINQFYFNLSFPETPKIQKIKVNRLKDNKIIESFEIPVDGYTTWVEKEFHTQDTYEFIVDNEKPFIVKNFTTKLETHCSWDGCDYPCEIVKYEINGKVATGGILLQKEGYVKVWKW